MTTTAPLIGPTYRPTVWCLNPACHAPIPADASECPECGEPVTRPVQVISQPSDLDTETVLTEGRY